MEQSDLFDESTPALPDDICRNRHGGDAMSELANESMAGSKDAIRRKVWEYFSQRPTICDEAEDGLGLSHQTCSARVSELKRLGLLRKTGETRKTKSGRMAAVLEAVGGNE